MNRRLKRVLASISLMSLILTTALTGGVIHAEQGTVTRIGESDRYATAAKVASSNWTTNDNVVLVSGEGYADAVSASVLAKKLDAPILLTTSAKLNDYTKSALDTLKPKNVYIVGGQASVSQSVRDELKNNNYNLIELQGTNRYETSVAVAKKLVELGTKADNLMLVGGEGFSDALSAAPVAAAKEQILLLGSNNDDSMKLVIQFIKANNSKVTVVGTQNVINEDMYNALGAIERVDGGIDRFETNMNVLTKFGSDLKYEQLLVASASGDGYADALVAASLAGKASAPLVLLDTTSSNATTKAIEYIKGKASNVKNINVVGGIGVISKSTEDAINSAIGNNGQAAAVEEPAVKSIYPVSLNQIAVEFNTFSELYSTIDVTKYEINGAKLVPSTGATVEDPNAATIFYEGPTLAYITLAHPRKQYEKLTVKVDTGIVTFDETKTIKGLSQDITISDTEAPKLNMVTVQGNNRIKVQFSEAVNLKDLSKGDILNKFKIDGTNISNYGVNDTQTYNTSLDKMKIADPSCVSSGVWGDIISFYLDSPMSTGTHVLKIQDGDGNGALSDAAGFAFKETSSEFKVESNTTTPVIKSIVHPENGRLYITFDRPIDTQTGADLSNYELNGKKLSGPEFCYLDEPFHDVLKVFCIPEDYFNVGSNVVSVSDKVKDVYRNKIASDTRVSFDNAVDSVKPTVNSVQILDNETIRVQFSKVVDYTYASNPSNYKLVDNEGTDISNHIDKVVNASDFYHANNNLFDIKLKKFNPSDSSDDWRLTSSKYTLTIKNIMDAETKANTMDDYTTTINGSDDMAPKVTGIYSKLRNTSSERDKVVVYFNENMDGNTLTNKDNYRFLDGEGDTKILPQDATITTGDTGKNAIIEFPSNYKVKTTGKTTTGSAIDVTGITVSNVKDEAGNTLAAPYSDIICQATLGAKVKDDTLRVYYDGDDLKVSFQFDKGLDTIEANDFTLGGVTPSIANFLGSKVTLTYKVGDLATAADKLDAPVITFANGKTNNDATKIDLVKSQGQAALLGIKATPQSTDETGLTITSLDDTLGNAQNTIYSYEAVPKTTCTDDDSVDFWTAERDINGTKIYITFDTPLDKNSGIKPNDFIFTSTSGAAIEADSVEINGNTVVFGFDTTNKDYDNALKTATEINVRVENSVSLRTVKDGNDNYTNYTPSDHDLRMRTINVISK